MEQGPDNSASNRPGVARGLEFKPIGSVSPSPNKKPVRRMYILKPNEIIIYMNYEVTQTGPLIERIRPCKKYTIVTRDMLAYEVLKNLISYPDDVDDYIVKFNDTMLDDLYKPIGDYIQDTKEAILIATPRPKFQVSAKMLGSPTIYTLDVHEYTFFSDIRYDMLGDHLCYKFNIIYEDTVMDLEKMLYEYEIKASVTFTFVPIMKSGRHAIKRAQQPVLTGYVADIPNPPNKTVYNHAQNVIKDNCQCINQMPGFVTTPHVYITQEEMNKYLPNPKLISRNVLSSAIEKHGFACVFIFETGSVYLLTKAQRDYFKSSMPVLFRPNDKLTTTAKHNLIAIIHALIDRYRVNTVDTGVNETVCNAVSTEIKSNMNVTGINVNCKGVMADMLQKLKQSKAERHAKLDKANTKLTVVKDELGL